MISNKVAIGGGVLAIGLVTTCYVIINPIVNGTSADADDWNEGTIGKTYGKYFLSAKANKHWGNDSSRLNTGSNDKFQTAINQQKGYGSSSEYLNGLCEEVYKLTNTNSIEMSNSTDNQKFSIGNIGDYCSPYILVSISMNSGQYSGQLGADNTNKTLFVDTNGNDGFGKIRKDDFGYSTGKLSKSNITGQDATNNVFKELEKSNDTSLQAFKKACEKAYKQSTSDSYKNKEDALVFCSMKLELSTTTQN